MTVRTLLDMAFAPHDANEHGQRWAQMVSHLAGEHHVQPHMRRGKVCRPLGDSDGHDDYAAAREAVHGPVVVEVAPKPVPLWLEKLRAEQQAAAGGAQYG